MTSGAFPATVFAARRARVLARLQEEQSVLLLPAAPLALRSRDVEHRYRPDSELFYLTGTTEPDVVAVLQPATDEAFTLFVRPRDAKGEVWTGPRLGPAGAKAQAGADGAYPLSELEERLPPVLAEASRIYARLGRGDRVERLVFEALARARSKGQRTGTGPRGVLDPGLLLDDLRLVKDEHEIATIRRAAEITVRACRAALAGVRPGVGEWEVEAELDAAARREGAFGPAFPTIVASGPNAAILHYVENTRRIGAGDLVLIDCGVEVSCYAADLSRTAPATGRFTPEQRAVYDVVRAASRRALAAAVPGRTIEDVQRAGLEAIVQGLIEVRVLEGAPEDLIEKKAHEPFFPHRISHWLGLDVHDVGDYTVAGQSRCLESGMIFTVEPGLYFPQDAQGNAARFAGIGVRIEDDVLIARDGHEVLTAAVPVEPDEIAGLVGR